MPKFMEHWKHGGWRKETSDRLLRIEQSLTRLEQMLGVVRQQQEADMATLADVQAKVTAEGTVVDSAITLLGQLAELVRQNATDPAALQALADQIDAQSSSLAAAITANTPAA